MERIDGTQIENMLHISLMDNIPIFLQNVS